MYIPRRYSYTFTSHLTFSPNTTVTCHGAKIVAELFLVSDTVRGEAASVASALSVFTVSSEQV